MRTIILTADARGDRPVGTWLRDIGFKLIETGCEINLSTLDGHGAQELLSNRGMEVVQVVDAYANVASSQHRSGAKRFVEDSARS